MHEENHRLFVYRIDLEDRISFVNDEWIAFGIENGLTELSEKRVIGKSLWDFIADSSVQHVYEALFNRVRAKNCRPKIPYRCDSPDCRRIMEMELFSSQDGEIEITSRILKKEFRPPVSILEHSADRSSVFLPICSFCKKMRLREDTWYEIEDAAAILGITNIGPYPQLSHSICDRCLEDWEKNLSLL